ncbi:MAG: putative glycoside hydrolase [bacterium]|nr:putative glycoside hydrolase [bacterium]MDZ4286211.1 putative glycoside hydrolase [Candidatus Sungbacteria bacterium]
MMKSVFVSLGVAAAILGGVVFAFKHVNTGGEFSNSSVAVSGSSMSPSATPDVRKIMEERIKEAQEKSARIKGVYMTAEVASDGGAAASRIRNGLIHLAETTEINAIVIDVKEVCGPEYSETRMKQLIDELHAKNIWAIARIVAFKDSSQMYVHPEWYLHRAASKSVTDDCGKKMYLREKGPDGLKTNEVLWRDNKGGYWLDPASEGVRNYLADFSKKIIDLGFDEIQFDYIRFPSDGDVAKAQFPVWDGKTPKYVILKSFFEFIHKSLKEYKPDIILSADMFGYAAIRAGDAGIGQRLEDIGSTFDYVSFMVYPSHYYSGLYLPADPAHNLAAIAYNGKDVRMYPGVTVGRSLRVAQDFLDARNASSSATSTIVIGGESETATASHVRLRPWLEDFFHDADKSAGRPYGVEKVRLQIDAAENVGDSGWILWNASNVYTQGALKPESGM